MVEGSAAPATRRLNHAIVMVRQRAEIASEAGLAEVTAKL